MKDRYKGTNRDEDAALGILRNIGEVQEGWQGPGQLVVADVKHMHQDLAIRKLHPYFSLST